MHTAIWSRGYYVSNIGSDEEKFRKYVQWQEKKEKEIEQSQAQVTD